MSQEDAKRFRTQADECRQEAAKALTQEAAEAWLRLAVDWMKLAEAAERRQSRFDRDF
ncbi:MULTISPECIES: hypothetical protein [unclassified Bradyrhizobium]|uniref:hypothetical protein n=1 Tax=unclassified Bradyrhizobium TaxID=2631580 RepID=UPI001FFAE106|nr:MULTISPECIES: hypothetical protein [unclassified Bradyrhizobium]MCK1503119.1 hypothetical protein [Bradyrhizobium sp. 188]MCK1568985.1 hypothetical protein [Bradyrhizobium sp. 173]MCK1676640.1 hypothetical protein [Bradyrhizobium sp. 150]